MLRVTNSSEFQQAMDLIGKKLKEDAEIIVKKLAMDAFVSVVNYTARDTGYAANNWDIAVNQLASDQVWAKPKGASKNEFQDAKIDQTEFEKIDYKSYIRIFNNTEYIKYLEYGTPKMAAQPMVKPTELKLYRQAEGIARALSIKNYDY